MQRITTLAALTLLALPASAAAARTTGSVLSVDSRHHAIEVVDAGHLVHGYRYHGRLPRLRTGSGISFRRSGRTISHVLATGRRSRSVSYYARVVRSSHRGLELALADGTRVKFSSGQLRHRPVHAKRPRGRARAVLGASLTVGNVTVNILGLDPGVTILVSESIDGAGNVTVTITLPGRSAAGTPAGSEQSVTGTVDEVDTDAFVLDTADGSQLRLHMAAQTLSDLGLSSCEQATVTYHQDAAMLIADRVRVTGASDSGDCGSGDQGQDEVGTITAISGGGVTVNTQDNGSMTFSVDSPDVTDGYAVGDLVDVTYDQLAGGSLDAWDIEYVQQDSTGVVTAVGDASLTVTDGDTGQSETFSADPADGMFDGVGVGDEVDVTYHQSNAQLVADAVVDGGTDS